MQRRVQQRFAMGLEVQLRPVAGEPTAPYRGQTANISSNGFYLVGALESFQEGSLVQLILWLPTGSDGSQVGLRGLGRVVRVDRRQGREVGVAVKFDRVEMVRPEMETSEVETFT